MRIRSLTLLHCAFLVLNVGQVAFGEKDARAVMSKPVRLWDDTVPLPLASEMSMLDGVKFHVIKRWDKAADGYTFLHGVNLAWHEGKLYASFGHNKGAENTVVGRA